MQIQLNTEDVYAIRRALRRTVKIADREIAGFERQAEDYGTESVASAINICRDQRNEAENALQHFEEVMQANGFHG